MDVTEATVLERITFFVSLSPIRHLDAEGNLLVRNSVQLVFFIKRSLTEFSADCGAVFDLWMEKIPADTLRWARIGANAEETSATSKNSVERCKRLLDPKRVEKAAVTAFNIEGPEQLNPDFRFEVVSAMSIAAEAAAPQTSLIEMRFPVEYVENDLDGFGIFALKAASMVPMDTGYCSPALNFSSEGSLRAAGAIIAPLAIRHPGYDVNRNRRTRFVLGRRSRGARWTTFLSNEVVKELGGAEGLCGKLVAGVEAIPAGKSLALKAGKSLEVGDTNQNDHLPLLCSMAKAIEPVTFFGDTHVESGIFRGDTGKFERWEKRFLR